MKKINNPFTSYLSEIDLHGSDREYAVYLTQKFIYESFLLNKKEILIIHGKGKNILKEAVHQELKENKYVKEYKLDNFNIGQTIVKLVDNK